MGNLSHTNDCGPFTATVVNFHANRIVSFWVCADRQ